MNHHRIGADKVFDLYDVRCIENYEDFRGDNNIPMTNSIILIPAILFNNGDGPIIQSWHIQNPASLRNPSRVQDTERPVSVAQHEDDFDITALYWTDMDVIN